MNKLYDIVLDKIKIGTTEFENADAPMGIVFGRIDFFNIKSGYNLFKQYCLNNNIQFQDNEDISLITTKAITDLQVFDLNGCEIKGEACSISGTDNDLFEIYIEAIPYTFYNQEFKHHVIAYEKSFSS